MARQMTDAPVEVFASGSLPGSLAGQPTAEGAEDELLTAKQAAELVGVTVERIRTLASDERVPAAMVSHKWWFSKQELLRIKAECPQVLYARRTPAVAQEHGDDGGAARSEPLAICFQCWRENIGGRPPARLTNVLCARHQREHDEFAASLRATS